MRALGAERSDSEALYDYKAPLISHTHLSLPSAAALLITRFLLLSSLLQ